MMSHGVHRGGSRFNGRLRLLATVIGLIVAAAATRASATLFVINFESVTPRDPALETYWDPNPGFTAAGADFSGGSYAGFVVSSSTTTGVAGYLYFGSEAEISAQSNGGAGGGVGGSSNFAVAYNGGSFIDLPEGYVPSGVSLTNTATTYEAILNGLYQATAFEAGDWFRVRFTGYSGAAGTGSVTGVPVDFFLADYRNGNSVVVDSWTAVDLAPLGEAASIVLSFASTDNDPVYGMNTPAYVALDDLTLAPILAPVPEPSGLALAGCCGAMLAGWEWRRRRRPRRAGAAAAG